jgi:hypothetical protein
MMKQTHEDVTIDKAGIEEILKLHVESTESIDRASTRVHFDVGSESHGQGYGEYDVTILKGAKVETTTPTAQDDVLKVLGRRTFNFGDAEVREAILDYVAKARGVDPASVSIDLKLQARHQGDRGGYEGPYLTGAVATIKIA